MDCLIDFVNIRVCDTDTPGEGGFINTLPGISLEVIDKIANEDQVTYRGVWNDAQTEAAIDFEIDFISEINKCFTLNAYCDYTEFICDNKTKLGKAWRYLLGAKLMQFRLYSTRLNRFTTIDLNQAQELLNHYTVSYEDALAQAVKVIDVSSCCMECGGEISSVTWLP